MNEKRFLSTSDLAKLLGISRIAVFKKIKNGTIKATKVGRVYIIDPDNIGNIIGNSINDQEKRLIDSAVTKAVSDYSETLKLLGAE